MKFRDIPRLTRWGSYQIDVDLSYLEFLLKRYDEDYGLDLDPDYQRGHVWTKKQQINYVEFLFRGGKSSREILFNCASWGSGEKHPIQIVDGKQRLTAVLKFLRNELPIFGGHYFKDFEDKPRLFSGLKFCINDLQTRAEVLQWYLEVNSGTPHTEEELERVRLLLESESSSSTDETT